MAYEFHLPDIGEGVAEAEVVCWRVGVGERVEEDADLVELDTDKAVVVVPSPVAGQVLEILVPEGSRVPVGTLLVRIGEEQSAAVNPNGGPEGRGPVKATPWLRKLAAELEVDLASVRGTGVDGSIRREDVLAAAGSAVTAPAPAVPGARQPLRGVRRRTAERTERAHREVPAVTVVDECDFTDLQAARHGYRYFAAVAMSVVVALQRFPELNATLEGGEVVLHSRYDLGLAVQTARGLVVPVIRAADQRDLDGLAAEVRRVVRGARQATLPAAELHGSTFTISNAGDLGGLFATPLVNVPEVAILGIHRIAPRPVVRDGEVVVRSIGHLSCTFDHRVVDGARAGAFLLEAIRQIERAGQALVWAPVAG